MAAIKVLFFDTNSLVKFFLNDENGCAAVKWLCNSDTRMVLTLHYTMSSLVRDEFNDVVFNKNRRRLSPERLDRIRHSSEAYFRQCFHVMDSKTWTDNEIQGLLSKYNLSGKCSKDMIILNDMIKHLHYLAGASLPHVVTSDKNFKKVIIGEGFKVIDPEIQKKSDIENCLLNL